MKLIQAAQTSYTVKSPLLHPPTPPQLEWRRWPCLNQVLDSEANQEVLLEEVPMGRVCCKVLKEVITSVV